MSKKSKLGSLGTLFAAQEVARFLFEEGGKDKVSEWEGLALMSALFDWGVIVSRPPGVPWIRRVVPRLRGATEESIYVKQFFTGRLREDKVITVCGLHQGGEFKEDEFVYGKGFKDSEQAGRFRQYLIDGRRA